MEPSILRAALFLFVWPTCALEVSSSDGPAALEQEGLVEAEVEQNGATSLLRRDSWWAPKVPTDVRYPQPKLYTGTTNPITCVDTAKAETIPCVDFFKADCKPWNSNGCSCTDDLPICVTDVAARSSPASPADARSATAVQYACCPRP
mmetsp:Transcript_74000/g.130720  ORF Transcript_74000/g.130720 Transcript_74000/m.130720 type:complete len:148 (-) Transcript_74000:64-507(-)